MMWFNEVEVHYYKYKQNQLRDLDAQSLSLGIKLNSKFKSDLGIERDTL